MSARAGEHPERTTIRRRESGAENGKKDLGFEPTVRPEGRPRNASQSATEATSELRGFHPAVRSIEQPIASQFHTPSFTPRSAAGRSIEQPIASWFHSPTVFSAKLGVDKALCPLFICPLFISARGR